MTEDTDQMRSFFAGERLIGEDFNTDQLDAWYAEEKAAYRDTGWQDTESAEHYPYHALNTICGYKRIPPSEHRFQRVLGIGSAHGAEFFPILSKIGKLIIIESDRRYWRNDINGVSCSYLDPGASGTIPIDSGSINLLTCFGVLHHIAKVSDTLKECARVLAPGGIALIREPIVSLGDWRAPRKGLTKNERGIPIKLFETLLLDAGFSVLHQSLVAHAAIGAAARRIGGRFWSGIAGTYFDLALCSLYQEVRYHRTSVLQKLTPTSAFFVLQKI